VTETKSYRAVSKNGAAFQLPNLMIAIRLDFEQPTPPMTTLNWSSTIQEYRPTLGKVRAHGELARLGMLS